MRWLLHESVLENRLGHPDMPASRLEEMLGLLAARGDDAIVLSGRRPALPDPAMIPTFAFVTVQLAALIHRAGILAPGVFWGPMTYTQTAWLAWLGRFALNGDITFLPWGEFVRRGPAPWAEIAREGRVFVRPDSGQKPFTGQTIAIHDFTGETHRLEAVSGIMPDTLVGICSPKPIDDFLEWRFWISRRQGVVASSPYSWREDVRLVQPPAEVRAAADALAYVCADQMHWAPDPVFVADFCLSDREARLIEINSASCSGFYGADMAKIVEAIAVAVTDEMSGE